MKVLAAVLLVMVSSTMVESMMSMFNSLGSQSPSRSRSPMWPSSRSSSGSSSRSHHRSHNGPKPSVTIMALTNIEETMKNDLGAVKSYLRREAPMPNRLMNGAGSQSQSRNDYQQRRPQQRPQQRRPQQSQQEEPSEENGWLFGKIEE